MQALSSPKSLVPIHPSTRRQILEARNIYQQCCETSSPAEVDTSQHNDSYNILKDVYSTVNKILYWYTVMLVTPGKIQN